jgi:hypothetical protein
MKWLSRMALALAVSATAAMGAQAGPAAAVHNCQGLDSIGNLIGNVRFFAEGSIRIAHISTEEPAAAPDHVLIFVATDPMGLECFAVSETAEGHGFGSIDFDGLHASYDATKGLTLTIPVKRYNNSTGASKPAGEVKVIVNRKGGATAVKIE